MLPSFDAAWNTELKPALQDPRADFVDRIGLQSGRITVTSSRILLML